MDGVGAPVGVWQSLKGSMPSALLKTSANTRKSMCNWTMRDEKARRTSRAAASSASFAQGALTMPQRRSAARKRDARE